MTHEVNCQQRSYKGVSFINEKKWLVILSQISKENKTKELIKLMNIENKNKRMVNTHTNSKKCLFC
jgi:hypothetical protein